MAIPASFRHCFASSYGLGGGRDLKEEELNKFYNQAKGRIDRLVSEGMAPRDAAMAAGAKLADEHRIAAAINRKNALKNLKDQVDRRTMLSGRAEGPLANRDGSPNPLAAVRSFLSGTDNPKVLGGKITAESLARGQAGAYMNAMTHELKKANLHGAFISGKLDDKIINEAYALKTGGKVGSSGSKEAAGIAQLWNKYHEMMRARLNAQGADIGNLYDFVMHNSHDWNKLRRAGTTSRWEKSLSDDVASAKWIADTMGRIDPGRTLEDAVGSGTDPNTFMRSIWDALVTGVHMSDEGGVGFKPPAFVGPGNLAKKISASRKLHWKDGAAAYAQFKQYGTDGTLSDHINRSFDRAAKQEALLRTYGTNPEAGFANDLRWLSEKYRSGNVDAVRQLENGTKGLQNLFDRLTGKSNIPENEMAATWARGIRSFQMTSKLNNVMFSHLSATTSVAQEMKRHGIDIGEGYRNSITGWLGGLQGQDARQMLDLLGASIEASHMHLASNAWTEGGAPGVISKFQNVFMKATGLPWALNWKQAGVKAGLARLLGQQINKDFDHLLPEIKDDFARYDISAKEWDALRAVQDHFKTSDGKVVVAPDAARRSSLSAADQETLAMKLAAFYQDAADRSTISPRIADKEWILRGTRPGSFWGEIARFFMQFKSWPIAMSRQTYLAEMDRSGLRGAAAARAAVPAAIHLIAGMTAFGYLRMTIRDLLNGETPHPLSLATFGSALAQGGGAGIYGDFLFGHSTSFGQDFANVVMGPTIGEGWSAIKAVWDLMGYGTGEQKNLKPAVHEALNLVHRNLPFVNLWQTRTAFDQMIWHQIQEYVNPGYLDRSERKLRERTGQNRWLSPHWPYGR